MKRILHVERNQIPTAPNTELQPNTQMPVYNAEGILTGFQNPPPTVAPENLPTINPKPITPTDVPMEDAALNTAQIPPDLQAAMDNRAQTLANDRAQAAQNYDVNEEDLVYNDKGQLVPEVGTKSKTYGDTWGENGWNDDAPEKRQNEVLSNLESDVNEKFTNQKSN